MSDAPTLQWLVDWANIGIVSALAASFIFGGASFFFGKRLLRAKDEQYGREKQASDEKIASANAESAKANERAEKLEQENLLLRKDVLELQERLQPRRLSNAQRRKLEAALMSAPKGAIKIECVWTPDNEPFTFARQLQDVLIRAGWTAPGGQIVACRWK